jgi:hypothetical protein
MRTAGSFVAARKERLKVSVKPDQYNRALIFVMGEGDQRGRLYMVNPLLAVQQGRNPVPRARRFPARVGR